MQLLRGMLGRPGAGILQMNGQPTAQNNCETGADGDLPGFRNWQNEQHVAALAELWDVDPIVIPDWAEPTHDSDQLGSGFQTARLQVRSCPCHAGGEQLIMHLSSYLGLLETGCATLGKSYWQVAEGHSTEADVRRICQQFAGQCDHQEEQLRPFTDRYGSHILPASRNGCTPTGCPARAAAGSGCCEISMICICWPATWRWRGWWLDRPPRGVVIKS